MTKVFIPGKLFLAGEYAITNPGNTAIIAATATGLTIEINSTDTISTSTSNTLSQQWQFQINHIENQYVDDWRYVRAAIKVLKTYIDFNHAKISLNEVNITITSELNSKFGKIGLGSSAAVVVGIIEALDTHFQLNLPIFTRFKLASIAHLHVQQNGSLGDIAAITYGGVIAYQSPDLSSFLQTKNDWLNPEIIDAKWPKLSVIPLPWPTHWQLLLGATHESADTKSAIANINLAKKFLSESQNIVQNIITTVLDNNYASFSKALRANQLLLNNNLPAGYLTPKLTLLLESLKDVAGKVSGAGFGDNGFAVFRDNADKIITTWTTHHIDAQVIMISPQKRG